MPHFPKPFFKHSRDRWYVQIGPRQYNLGPDKEAAFRRYHELMRQEQQQSPALPSDTVLAVIERFLAWVQEHRAPRCYEWYRWRLREFARTLTPSLTVAELKHFHLDDFLAKHPEWKSGTKHGMARAVLRALHWASRKGYVDRNPLADYEKPRAGKRTVVIAPETFRQMLELAGGDEFRDLLLFTWETAARPQETLIAQARHVDLDNARLVFPADEAKGEQWPRVIYLSDAALGIVRRLLPARPEGALFRNADGRAWTTDAVNCAFRRLQVRMGTARLQALGIVPEPIAKPPKKERKSWAKDRLRRFWAERKGKMAARRKLVERLARQNAPKYCLYHLRHSWLDRALKRGVDALTCAILMGHRDPSTISRVYQHLSQSPDYLRESARRATG